MLSHELIEKFYSNTTLTVPRLWNLSRKHFRIETQNDCFVKLNYFENRLDERSLRKYLISYAPLHVYFSVTNWLFPERVSKKYKANCAVPVGGEYVVDIDWHMVHEWHRHVASPTWNVCKICVGLSKQLAILACDQIQYYYSKLAIVFSGRRGFLIHVLDFDYHDWATYNEKNLIKTYEAARFKFSKTISLQTYTFDRAHFILSTDPMRVITVPNTMNAETGLICSFIGGKKDLARQRINDIIAMSQPIGELYGYPEPVEGSETSPIKQSWENSAWITAMTSQPTTRFIEKTLVD